MTATANVSRRKVIIPKTKTSLRKTEIKKAVIAAKTALRDRRIEVTKGGDIRVFRGGEVRVFKGSEIRIIKVGDGIRVEEVAPKRRKAKLHSRTISAKAVTKRPRSKNINKK